MNWGINEKKKEFYTIENNGRVAKGIKSENIRYLVRMKDADGNTLFCHRVCIYRHKEKRIYSTTTELTNSGSYATAFKRLSDAYIMARQIYNDYPNVSHVEICNVIYRVDFLVEPAFTINANEKKFVQEN